MTPDDTPIPSDDAPKEDAVARAARRGLGRIADADALGELSWEAVQSGVRRHHRRRVTAIGAACAVVLLSIGIAFAAAGSNDGDSLSVAQRNAAASTTTDATTTTTTPDLPPTTMVGATGPGGLVTTTTVNPAPVIPLPGIEGILTLASPTWVAEQPAAFTLVVRNANPFSYRFGPNLTLGIVVQGEPGGCIGVDQPDLVLAADEQRTYTAEFTPRPDMIGPASITTVVLYTGDNYSNCFASDAFAGVATVPVTIVPPGWVDGQPLDPSQGSWRATVSADATNLGAGESTAIHIGLRNAGTQPQRTDGYGSLAVVCRGPGIEDGFPVPIGSATIAPDATQMFTVDFPAGQITGPGTVVCSLGMTFNGVPNPSSASQHIDTDIFGIVVTSDTATTTTTTIAPDTTDTTTP